jgi:hypothetical protein
MMYFFKSQILNVQYYSSCITFKNKSPMLLMDIHKINTFKKKTQI